MHDETLSGTPQSSNFYPAECPDGTDCTQSGCLDAHMWRCVHEWLDRPESDTRECLICGTEVSG